MIYYRLPLLIIISLSFLGFSPYRNANALSFNLLQQERQIEIIAQGNSTNSSSSSLSADPSAYDKHMQAGYKASKEKDYQKAKENFTKALEARPNDIYAEQALQNVEVYLAKQGNSLNNLTSSGIWLFSGLMAITIGVGVTLWLFFRRHSNYTQEQFEEDLLKSQKEEKEYFDPNPTENNKSSFKEPINSQKHQLTNKSSSNSLANDSALPVQTTTRLPNRDPIEILIDDLQEKDPKKRRKAIWELARKADSRAMKPLVDLMIDTDSQERSLILEALSQISARTLKPMNQALALSLQDKNPQVRKNAIRDLTKIYELMSQISQLLCHAIDDTDQDVQDTAKWAINQLNTQMPPRLDILDRNSDSEVTVEQSYTDSIEEI